MEARNVFIADLGPRQPVIRASLLVKKVAFKKNCSISALSRFGKSLAFSNSPSDRAMSA